jgi:hypothetical protein
MAKGIKTGGRKPGTPNKATAEVRSVAQQYAPAAIEELARLSTGAESEAARVAASKELLDRAYGKAAQPVAANVHLNASGRVEDLTDAELMAIVAQGAPKAGKSGSLNGAHDDE